MDFSGLSSVAGNITSPFALFGIVVLAVVGIAKPVLSSAALNNRARERLVNRIILAATVLALGAIVAGLFVAPLQRDSRAAAVGQTPAAADTTLSVGGDNHGQVVHREGGDVQIVAGPNAEQLRALAERAAEQAVASLREINAQNVAPEQREQAFTRQVTTLGELLALLGDRDDVAARAARQHIEVGDFDAAQRLLRAALADQRDGGDAAIAAANASALGLMAEMQLDYERAADYYRQAIQFAPEDGDYANHLGLLELERGHAVEVFGYFRRA